MSKLLCLMMTCLWAAAAFPAEVRAIAETAVAGASPAEPDSRQIERDLQRLPWKQFRSVVESVPKLKADVDAYGPLGWQYVKAHYTTYGWKRNIDKLDATQKKRLAELIEDSKNSR